MNTYFFKSFFVTHLAISLFWLFPPLVSAEEQGLQDVRQSILAGTWYPGSRESLSKSIGGYLSRVKAHHLGGQLKAVIVPHAAHKYSGQVAAHAYRLLEGNRFKQVILIGPSHRVGFDGVSVNLQSAYETPLGIVPVNQEMGRGMLDSGHYIRWLRKAHAREHSLEIQLPFLQTVLQNFQIVPLLMGRQDYHTCSKLADTLLQVLGRGEDTLLLASSDLSHFHPYNRAKTLDHQFIKKVRMFDSEGLSKDLAMGKCEACGGGPVITILLAARKLGADRAVILNYANSGDVTGDHRSVVGYMSAALISGK